MVISVGISITTMINIITIIMNITIITMIISSRSSSSIIMVLMISINSSTIVNYVLQEIVPEKMQRMPKQERDGVKGLLDRLYV